MKIASIATLTVLTLLLYVCGLSAQPIGQPGAPSAPGGNIGQATPGGSPGTTGPAQQTLKGNFILSQNLIGASVTGRQGENLGQVEAMVINTDTGRVSELVISPAPVFEMGDRLVAVPWQKFQVSSGPRIVLNANKQTLAKAPSFARSEMPAFANVPWRQKIYGWWQVPTGAWPPVPITGGSEAGRMKQQAGS